MVEMAAWPVDALSLSTILALSMLTSLNLKEQLWVVGLAQWSLAAQDSHLAGIFVVLLLLGSLLVYVLFTRLLFYAVTNWTQGLLRSRNQSVMSPRPGQPRRRYTSMPDVRTYPQSGFRPNRDDNIVTTAIFAARWRSRWLRCSWRKRQTLLLTRCLKAQSWYEFFHVWYAIVHFTVNIHNACQLTGIEQKEYKPVSVSAVASMTLQRAWNFLIVFKSSVLKSLGVELLGDSSATTHENDARLLDDDHTDVTAEETVDESMPGYDSRNPLTRGRTSRTPRARLWQCASYLARQNSRSANMNTNK